MTAMWQPVRHVNPVQEYGLYIPDVGFKALFIFFFLKCGLWRVFST